MATHEHDYWRYFHVVDSLQAAGEQALLPPRYFLKSSPSPPPHRMNGHRCDPEVSPGNDSLQFDDSSSAMPFCSTDNLRESLRYIGQELTALGVHNTVASSPGVDVVLLVNALYEVLQRLRRQMMSREEDEMRQRRTENDIAHLQQQQIKLKVALESNERELAVQRETERQLLTKNDLLSSRLKLAQEEAKRLESALRDRESQYKHDVRKREREIIRLKERVHTLLADKSQSKTTGLDLSQPINRLDGKRGIWQGVTKHEEEMYRSIIGTYEERQKELMIENNELRLCLQDTHQELATFIEPASSQSTNDLDSDIDDIDTEQLSEAHYQMPYDMIRGNVTKNLRERLQQLKKCFRTIDNAKSAEDSPVPGQPILSSTAVDRGSTSSASAPEVDRLQKQVQRYKEVIEQQEVLLQQFLEKSEQQQSDVSESSVFHMSDLYEDQQGLETHKKLFEKQKLNFEDERKSFTEAALRLAQERKVFEEQRSAFLQNQFLQISPLKGSTQPTFTANPARLPDPHPSAFTTVRHCDPTADWLLKLDPKTAGDGGEAEHLMNSDSAFSSTGAPSGQSSQADTHGTDRNDSGRSTASGLVARKVASPGERGAELEPRSTLKVIHLPSLSQSGPLPVGTAGSSSGSHRGPAPLSATGQSSSASNSISSQPSSAPTSVVALSSSATYLTGSSSPRANQSHVASVSTPSRSTEAVMSSASKQNQFTPEMLDFIEIKLKELLELQSESSDRPEHRYTQSGTRATQGQLSHLRDMQEFRGQEASQQKTVVDVNAGQSAAKGKASLFERTPRAQSESRSRAMVVESSGQLQNPPGNRDIFESTPQQTSEARNRGAMVEGTPHSESRNRGARVNLEQRFADLDPPPAQSRGGEEAKLIRPTPVRATAVDQVKSKDVKSEELGQNSENTPQNRPKRLLPLVPQQTDFPFCVPDPPPPRPRSIPVEGSPTQTQRAARPLTTNPSSGQQSSAQLYRVLGLQPPKEQEKVTERSNVNNSNQLSNKTPSTSGHQDKVDKSKNSSTDSNTSEHKTRSTRDRESRSSQPKESKTIEDTRYENQVKLREKFYKSVSRSSQSDEEVVREGRRQGLEGREGRGQGRDVRDQGHEGREQGHDVKDKGHGRRDLADMRRENGSSPDERRDNRGQPGYSHDLGVRYRDEDKPRTRDRPSSSNVYRPHSSSYRHEVTPSQYHEESGRHQVERSSSLRLDRRSSLERAERYTGALTARGPRHGEVLSPEQYRVLRPRTSHDHRPSSPVRAFDLSQDGANDEYPSPQSKYEDRRAPTHEYQTYSVKRAQSFKDRSQHYTPRDYERNARGNSRERRAEVYGEEATYAWHRSSRNTDQRHGRDQRKDEKYLV